MFVLNDEFCSRKKNKCMTTFEISQSIYKFIFNVIKTYTHESQEPFQRLALSNEELASRCLSFTFSIYDLIIRGSAFNVRRSSVCTGELESNNIKNL